MTPIQMVCAAALVLVVGSAVDTVATEAQSAQQFPTSEVHLQNAEHQSVGEAVLRQTANGVLITVKLRNLPPGEHGFHVHEHGKCQPPFESAGAHFNPTDKSHGYEDPKGPHAGDLPNIIVPSSGTLEIELLAPALTLQGKPNSLVDEDGASLVIHGTADDYRTDPAGNSGDRIACGIIERPRMAAEGEVEPRTADRGGTPTGTEVPRGAMQAPPPKVAQ